MKALITNLISGRASDLSGHVSDGITYVRAQYTPNQFELIFAFDEDKLTDIAIADELGGSCVLFGESIATHQLKMVELSCAMNKEIINYKNQIS